MVKRGGYRLREGDQIPTRGVTIPEIMSDPTFALGVVDARAGRPYHPDYDVWADCNLRWSYERGRMWATLTPRHVPLKVNGTINPDAVSWYARHVDSII
jgi:hypothetical protein